MPVPGWTGTYEWEEYVPVDQLPYIENPPMGYLGTANNQVIQPESTGYPINFEGNVAHRVTRMFEVLDKGNNGRPIVEQLGTLQLDAVDIGWRDVRPLYTKALTPLLSDSDARIAEAAKILLSWNGDSTPEAVGPSLFQALNAHLVKRTLEDEMSEATMKFVLTYFNAEPLVFGIFGHPENPAWDDRTTKKVETAEEIIREQFKVTVVAMEKAHGKDFGKWTWEKVAPFVIHHPFGSEKSLSKYVNRGPFPTRGSVDTLFKNQFMRKDMTSFPVKYGPVLRVMVDFNDLPGSKMCVPGGQSGRPASKHYDDQMEMFMTGDGISMEMDFDRIKEKSIGRLVMKPGE
jgi:penicillin amidase